MEDNFETTNINLEWLNNIYSELKLIQDLERTSREGCRNLMEYLQIPIDNQRIILPDSQYKNMKFFALELDILISNLSPVVGDKIEGYKERLGPILKNIDNRTLFLQERRVNNRIVELYTLPFLNSTVEFLVSIKSNIIRDIAHILYLPPEEKGRKKW